MPITPLGRFYSSSEAIKVYNHENGNVYVTRGKNFYAVHIIKQTSAYSEEHKSRGRLDAIAASEFFDFACRYLRNEIQWTEPTRKFTCKYNPHKSCGCTDKNCPKKLGGADYRVIFGGACPWRKTRTR